MASNAQFLFSEVDNVFTGHGHYKLEFSCSSVPQDLVVITGRFGLRVAGTQYYRNSAQQFIRDDPVSVRLVRERFNFHDKNAIRVEGVPRKGRRYKIGYLPAEEAKAIVDGNLLKDIRAELHLAQISASGYTFVDISLRGTREARRALMSPVLVAEIENGEKEKEKGLKARQVFAEGRAFEKEGAYDDALKIYRGLLSNLVWYGPSESDLYERISICYKKKGDHAKVVEILEQCVRNRAREYRPCSTKKINRLNRSRKMIGLPELESWYHDRIRPESPIRPQLYPELNTINRKTWRKLQEAGVSVLQVNGLSIPTWSNNSLMKIEVANRNDWERVKKLLPNMRSSSVYVKGDGIVCVLVPVQSSEDT
jgi:tetratricopeptide (TPR) repeat protein